MEEYEYEDDWDEEEEDEEEGGWGLSAEEIEKRLQQVNQEQDKRKEEKEEQKKKKRGRKKDPTKETKKEKKKKKDPNAPPKTKRPKRQGLKLLLIRDYLYNEASKEKPKNADHIMEFLRENYDIDVSDKTIYNDIKRLRTDVGVPIVYNAKKLGYYIDERPFSAAELRLLVDCIRNAEFITKEDTAFLTEKVLKMATTPDRIQILEELNEEDAKSQTDNSILQNITLIAAAIEAKRKISFNRIEYVAERTTHTVIDPEVMFASPHKLAWRNGKYILECAVDFDDGDQTHLKCNVAMLANIKITGVPSSYRKLDSTGTPTVEEARDMVYGKRRAITIRFRNDVLDEVVNELGEDALLTKEDDYHFKVTVKERLDNQFLRWLADFGCYAKILGPEDVIDYYIDWHKRKIHELETLYQQNLEPIGIISLEEYDKLDDEQFKTLVYDMDFD